MNDVDVVVIGAGQAGLSAAYFLAARGFVAAGDAAATTRANGGTADGRPSFVVLDADAAPGGAWQHRWHTLRMRDVHGLHPLPEMDDVLGEGGDRIDPERAARDVVADAFGAYERHHQLPVLRPVQVTAVGEAGDGRLLVETDRGDWRARGLINATGTWTRPFWPVYPGADSFRGRQLHTADYDGPETFADQHVVVVGGGHSAVQHLAEIAAVATTTWVTRRPPTWRTEPFDAEAGRAAVARVEEAVAAGRRPSSVVSVTGLVETPAVVAARDRGALERLPMFDRVTPDGVAWDDGREVAADAIVWATGFRHAIDHLAPLRLRDPAGGIRMQDTHVADDPRVHLLGYGPSASTIGANRAARVAVRDLRRHLGHA